MVQFTVLRAYDGWDVFKDDQRVEHQPTRLMAIETAYLEAVRTQGEGARSTLLVQNEGSELEEWRLASWP